MATVSDIWEIRIALAGGILASTAGYLHQGKALLNPIFPGKITKEESHLFKIFICTLIGGSVAYLLSAFLYAPDSPARAVFIGLVTTPFVHDGKMSQLVSKR